MIKVRDRVGIEQLHINTVQNSDFICGVEYELENTQVNVVQPIFKKYPGMIVTEDGSLRNVTGSYGVEVITPPMSYVEALVCFTELHESFKYVEEPHSERTSIHVHVNVAELDEEAFKLLVLLYILLEPVFFSLVEPNRKHNIHCVPLKDTSLPIIYKRGLTHIGDWCSRWSKYTAFNLMPVFKQGSVEFRHLHGTNDYEIFHKWLKQIYDLYNFSRLHNPQYLLDYLLSEMSITELYYLIYKESCPLKEEDFKRSKMDLKLAFI